MSDFNQGWNVVRRFAAAIFYIGFAVFLGYSVVFQGLSAYKSDSAFRSGSFDDAEAAVRLQPDSPNAREIVAELSLRNKNYAGAADALREALRLRENDFLLWLKLGYAQYKGGDEGGSETAYERAVDLAPNYSQPYYYFGRMFLETSRPERAFPYLSAAAERDVSRYAEVLHLARLAYPNDPAAIEKAAEPRSAEARRMLAEYFIKYSFMTSGLKMFLTGPELTKKEKDAFVGTLVEKQKFQDAYDVWSSKFANAAGDRQLIFDGGFETLPEADETAFGWRIDPEISNVSAALVEKEPRSGSRALEIKFYGDVEIGRNIVSQLTYLKPDTKYQLKFYFRSSKVVSAGLPAVVVAGQHSADALGTAVLRPTNGQWVEAAIDFKTNSSPGYRIGLTRKGCGDGPCPIFGEIYLDDFSLTER